MSEECNEKTLGNLLLCLLTPACFPCRVFPRAPGERGAVPERHVCPDVRHAVHAELRGVPGPLHGAEALLHGRQREPGGNAERLLGSAAGEDVPAYKPAVPFQ